MKQNPLVMSPFFPTTDSGDVSSIRDVDMLVLLRVPSSCFSRSHDKCQRVNSESWTVLLYDINADGCSALTR